MANKKTAPEEAPAAPGAAAFEHGASRLDAVTVDTYNAELRDGDGFIGDRASKRAFHAILDDWREKLRGVGEDPLGDEPSNEIGKKRLDRLLADGDVEAAGLIHGAIEEFARELAQVTRRFLRMKAWRGVQRIAIGGGFRSSRVGELSIGRAAVLLKAEHGHDVELRPIRHHPDEAGLIGGIHLAPSWMFAGRDCVLAADIGGSNIRAGLVELNQKKKPDLSAAHVMDLELWRHADDQPSRDDALERFSGMLSDLVKKAERKDHKIAPIVAIGCPGLIAADGTIARGGQNLPGNWEGAAFNLPARIREALPRIGGEDTIVIMHNDAVAQGLSEIQDMKDVAHWGVLTIGTGLGNACFTNISDPDED